MKNCYRILQALYAQISTLATATAYQKLVPTLTLILLFGMMTSEVYAQEVNVTKTANTASQKTGETITYNIQGGCSDLVNDCVGAILVDQLGPNVEYTDAGPIFVESMVNGSIEIVPIIAVYDPVEHTITWDFTTLSEGGMPDGTSFSIEVVTKIIPGSTPDGTSIDNTIVLDSDAATQISMAQVAAEATPQWSLSKVVTSGPIFHDRPVTYEIAVQNEGGGIGNLNLDDVVITDVLPPGAVLQSTNPMYTTFDPGTGTISWELGAVTIATTNLSFEVEVIYPLTDPLNNTDAGPIDKLNTAELTATPIGEDPITLNDDVNQPLLAPLFLVGLAKMAQNNNSIIEDETNYFEIVVTNESTVNVDDFTLSDELPNQLNLENIQFSDFPPGAMIVLMEVELNESGTFMTYQTNIAVPTILDISADFPGDYVSAFRINFGTVASGFSGTVSTIVTPAVTGTPPTAVANGGVDAVDYYTDYTNNASISAVRPGSGAPVGPAMSSDDMCIAPRAALIEAAKTVAPNYVDIPPGGMTTGNPYFTGSRVQFTLHLENDGEEDGYEAPNITSGRASENLENPVMSDLLPPGLIYEPGSWQVINTASGPNLNPLPIFTRIDGYGGGTDTLLSWQFDGFLAPGDFVDVIFNAYIDKELTAFTVLTNTSCIGSATSAVTCAGNDCLEPYGPMGLTAPYVIDDYFSDLPSINEMCCALQNLTVVDSMGTLAPTKEVLTSGPYAPTGSSLVNTGLATDTVEYLVTVANSDMANFGLSNPIGMDLLPPELDFVEGSVVLVSNTTGLSLDAVGGNPTFESMDDFAATGSTLMRWRYSGSFPIGSSVQYSFKATIRPGSGGSVQNVFNMTTNTMPYLCGAPSSPTTDVNDLDGDGDVMEQLCAVQGPPILISDVTSLGTTKFVRGANDTEFLRSPNIASTNPDDIVDFRLIISNPGNAPLTEVIVYDIFPYVGDVGVQLVNQNRETAWRPYLIAPIAIPPFSPGITGITIDYSTSTNPCRPEVFTPAGDPGPCDANWGPAPADLSTVQAIRIMLEGTLMQGDSLLVDIAMQSPEFEAEAGSIAWNSLARNAAEVPAQEPNKVGVRLDYADLALIKTLASDQNSFGAGESITFNIEVFNQGNITADSILLVDYNDPLFNLDDPNWTMGVNTGTVPNLETATRMLRKGVELPAGGLEQGQSTTVQITFMVDPSVVEGDVIVNRAEIVEFYDPIGNLREDYDGVFDAIFGNDPGGRPLVDGEDDEINGNPLLTPGEDEDNEDPAQVCVILVNAGMDLVVCPNEPVDLTALGASLSPVTLSGEWVTSGTGTFNDTNGSTGEFGVATTYAPSLADVESERVTLRLMSTNDGEPSPCSTIMDEVVISFETNCGEFPWGGN